MSIFFRGCYSSQVYSNETRRGVRGGGGRKWYLWSVASGTLEWPSNPISEDIIIMSITIYCHCYLYHYHYIIAIVAVAVIVIKIVAAVATAVAISASIARIYGRYILGCHWRGRCRYRHRGHRHSRHRCRRRRYIIINNNKIRLSPTQCTICSIYLLLPSNHHQRYI